MVIVWLVIFAILLVCELISLGLTTIWFAGGSLAGMITALCGGNILVQVIVGLIVSVFLLVTLRPVALKYFNKDRTRTNVEELVGQTAKVTKRIDNFNNEGQILLKGLEWTARSADDEVIEEGEMVTVEKISGVKAIVRKN
ncbi:MAG: NfeD family protein [Lachnospiraceae bacterium]|mgnify:FL=1|nr:NfeD family protein [Lachnospiraceae bacterium]